MRRPEKVAKDLNMSSYWLSQLRFLRGNMDS